MRSNKALRWALAGAVLLTNVVAGWFPFVIDPPRHVGNTAVRAADGAWTVSELSLVTAEAPELLRGMQQRGRMHVSVVAAPEKAPQSGPARIFAIGRSPHEPSFMIGLDLQELVVRFPCGERARNEDAEWRLPAPRADVLTVTVDFDSNVADAPSVQVGDAPVVRLANVCPDGAAPRIQKPDTLLSLGNVSTGHRPFAGQIRSLTASSGTDELNLLTAVQWQAPARYWLWPERLYEPPAMGDQMLVNLWHLLAFVPLGYLAALGGLTAWSAMGMAGSLAVLLALGKVLMAGRHPETLDVLLNTGGAALGFYVSQLTNRRAQGKA